LRRIIEDNKEADPDRRLLETMKANYGRKGDTFPLTWLDGVFVPDREDDDRQDRNEMAERVFMNLLSKLTKQGRTVSPKPSSAYAPKIFDDHPESEGVTKKAFAMAMESLLSREAIAIKEGGSPSRRTSYLAEVKR